ncbi:phage portal protein [Leifsonia sp. NPDC014704]|uniref:phage portal protein n=1 Tax=Leifsonia sp. NPDC014704 TaxID=3364123 RepID=UPI0036F453BB
MGETIRIGALTEDERVTLGFLLDQLEKKKRRNLLRSSYYDGRRAVKQIGMTLPPQYRNIGLALGWAAKGVDGLARRCNIDKFVWPKGDLDALGMPELEDSNFLQSELAQARTDSLIHGVSYLITTRGVEEDGEPPVLVHAKDGLNATGEWNTRKRALDSLLSVTSREDNRVTGFVLYLDNETINADKVDGQWTVDRSEHTFHVPADPLVYRPRASRRMGRSRITRAVMSHVDSALRELLRLEAHMDIYSIPKLFLLGADESIFKNPDGSLKPAWQMVFGRAFGIPDADPEESDNTRADVKQFDAQSPQPHLADLNALAKLMARETDLPDSDFALTDMANPTSGDSYTASRENLIAEAEGATDDWSVGIRKTVHRALAMQNGLTEVPKEWRSIAPKWRSPIYLSRAAEADAGGKQLAAVSWLAETEVGLELIGLDEQQISRALAQKAAAERAAAGRALVANLRPAAAQAAAPAQADVVAG